jgi:group I intron endonuclease
MPPKAMFQNHSGIYEIRNLINNKIYIGQASNLRKRENDHFEQLRRDKHKNLYLQRSFNKYGEDNFVFNILLYCEQNELTYYEQGLVDRLSPEYNLRRDCVDSNLGIKFSDEVRKKLSELHKGWVMPDEQRKRQSESRRGENNPNFGKHWDEEVRKSMGRPMTEERKEFFRQLRTGTTMPIEIREKIAEGNRGKIMSEDSKKKLSESKMGHPTSEETRAKLIESHLGKKDSEETKKKKSIKSQGRKYNNSTSEYIGVFFSKKENGWLAQIQCDKKRFRIGVYDNEKDAALAYNKKAIELFGKCANLNDIESSLSPSEDSKRKRSSSSRYKGVYLVKRTGKWNSRIYLNPTKSIHVGTFDTEKEAVEAYNKKALELTEYNIELNIIIEEKEE